MKSLIITYRKSVISLTSCLALSVCMLQAQATVLRLGPVETEIDNLRSAKPEALSSILRRHHSVTKLDLEWVTLHDKDWKILEAMPNLSEIEINRATPEVLGHLSKLPHLRKLGLRNSDISYEEMSKVPAMRTVTELGLDCEKVRNNKYELNLKPFPSIRTLSLEGILLDGALDLRPLAQYSEQLSDLSICCKKIENQAELGKLSKLKKLDLHFPKIDDKGSEAIGNLANLEVLNLCGNELPEPSYQSIAKLKQLIHLKLLNNRMPASALKQISSLSNLQYLEIGNGKYSDVELCSLSELHNLRHLEFSGAAATEGKFLTSLKGIPLAYLKLDGTKLDEAAIKAISDIKTLQKLTFYPCTSKPEWANHLGQLRSLKEFSIACPKVGADAWATGIGNLTKLTTIDLSNSDLSDAGLTAIARVHGLECLNLNYTKISGNSLAVISSNFPNLKTLTLSGCALKDSDLSRLKGLNLLERLECEGANLTDQAILELQQFPRLKILALDFNRITGETLGDLVRQPRLENLGLRGTQLTSSGLLNLRNKSITSLDISSTEVDEHAVPFLRTLPNLKHLDHAGCGFINAGPLPGQTNEISLFSVLPADIASRDIGLTKDKRSREELELALTHANLSLAKNKNPYNYETRGRILFALGGYSEAVADLNIVIDDLRHPKGYICSKFAGSYTTSLFLAILSRAHAQNALGHYQEALTDSSMAVSLNRLSSQARKEAGYAGLKLGKFTDALKQLSRGVEINPKSPELHKYKAEVLKKLGREAEAAKEFELADKLGFVSEYP